MSRLLKILFLGDVFGEPGRRAIATHVPRLKRERALDLVFANIENAAAGRGVTQKIAQEVMGSGVDYMTSGNHVFDVRDSVGYFSNPECRILRPYNFPKSSPGKGLTVVLAPNGARVGLVNLMGRVHIEPGVDLPFSAVDQALMELQGDCDAIVVDFHAEATSEKRAMGWHLDGRVQLVVGTHTHVQTADDQILPQGTGYITDLGMTGPHDSVIGMDKDVVLHRMRHNLPAKFEPAKNDPRLCGMIAHIDLDKKKAVHLERICERG